MESLIRTAYFAVIDDEKQRRGPFATMQEASAILKEASRIRGYTDEIARHFFLYESSVVAVQIVNGQTESFNVGWLAREESGREEPVLETTEVQQETYLLETLPC
jgi:hypothetical protein